MSENKDIHNIANSIANAQVNIATSCKKFGRGDLDVTLMAVSKTKPIESVLAAYQAGQRIFGENYAQELADKSEKLAHLTDIEWHYIGPIQSNKTKLICQSCQWIDSVDRVKIATRLSQHCVELDKVINILIQVNISKSDKKSGILIEQVEEFAAQVSKLPNIKLKGLMAIPDKYDNIAILKQEFNAMYSCYSDLQQLYPDIDTLSLGMSQDMETAIECGSTMVRIGTDIFGLRDKG